MSCIHRGVHECAQVCQYGFCMYWSDKICALSHVKGWNLKRRDWELCLQTCCELQFVNLRFVRLFSAVHFKKCYLQWACHRARNRDLVFYKPLHLNNTPLRDSHPDIQPQVLEGQIWSVAVAKPKLCVKQQTREDLCSLHSVFIFRLTIFDVMSPN